MGSLIYTIINFVGEDTLKDIIYSALHRLVTEPDKGITNQDVVNIIEKTAESKYNKLNDDMVNNIIKDIIC